MVKRANAISCDTKGEKIFVADKFGDVYRYNTFVNIVVCVSYGDLTDVTAWYLLSHAMDPTSGEPDVILGHVSMITAMVCRLYVKLTVCEFQVLFPMANQTEDCL